jgi:hypothetical protein
VSFIGGCFRGDEAPERHAGLSHTAHKAAYPPEVVGRLKAPKTACRAAIRGRGMVVKAEKHPGEARMSKVLFLCAVAAPVFLGGSLAMAQVNPKDDPPAKYAPKDAAKSGVYSGIYGTIGAMNRTRAKKNEIDKATDRTNTELSKKH